MAETAKHATHGFVRQHGAGGQDIAPSPEGLVDRFGVPLAWNDTRTTDIHGRDVQPSQDPGQNYTPQALTQGDYEASRAEAARAEARARRGDRFAQGMVDEVRFRVTLLMARDCLRERRRAPCLYHLWWPDAADPGAYELRQGNAPSDYDRPYHLRRLDLSVDLTTDIPADIAELMRPNGVMEGLVQKALDESDNPKVSSAQLLMETVRRLASVYAWRGGSRR